MERSVSSPVYGQRLVQVSSQVRAKRTEEEQSRIESPRLNPPRPWRLSIERTTMKRRDFLLAASAVDVILTGCKTEREVALFPVV